MTWPKVKLGDVLRLDLDRVFVDASTSYPMIGVLSFGRGLFEREPVENGKTSYRFFNRLKTDHVVMSQLFGWEGALALSTDEFAGRFLSPQFPTFLCDGEKLDRDYLGWAIRRPCLWKDLGFRATGMGDRRRTLTPEALLSCEIPLPPLFEQKRVVAKIESLSAKIDEARILRIQSEEEVGSIFLSHLGVAIRPSDPGWKRETVADVVQSLDAGWSPQCDIFPAVPGEWGVLKTTSVQWCEFQPRHNKALPPGLTPVPGLAVIEGDVLVTRAGPQKRVGVVAMVRSDEPRLTISDKLIRLRANRSKVDPRFLELSLASPSSQDHLFERKTGLADAQVNISQAIIKATPVAYPGLDEQRRIISEFDALKTDLADLQHLQSSSLEELDAMLPAILDRAFSGQL
jgi:type I restriction enzyme S subunit